MRAVIAGGGTGGHLFPGLAVAEELKKRHEAMEVIFIGTEHGIESKVVPREGYQIRFLRVEGFVGRSALRKIKAFFRLLTSMVDSRRMLLSLKPDIVIGTGGYVSFCPVAMAWLMRIPTLIMEQNIVPGIASRLLGKLVDAVAITYHESLSEFPRGRTFLTGNPVRSSIFAGSRESAFRVFPLEEGLFTVFVFGGSRGARAINNTVIGSLNHLLDLKEKVQFLHQTGEADYESVREAYRKSGFKAVVAPFIYQMAEAYAASDIVVSRSGATTLAELTALGKPAILIPFPYAAAGHQEFNARKFSEIKAAKVILESSLSGELLSDAIRELYMSDELRARMRKQSRIMGRPDAAQKAADIVLSLIKSRKGAAGNV